MSSGCCSPLEGSLQPGQGHSAQLPRSIRGAEEFGGAVGEGHPAAGGGEWMESEQSLLVCGSGGKSAPSTKTLSRKKLFVGGTYLSGPMGAFFLKKKSLLSFKKKS